MEELLEELLRQVRAILARQLDGIDEESLGLDTRIAEIHADSINVVELIMAVEDLYDVEFPEGELENSLLIGDLVAGFYNYLKSVGR